MPDALSFSTAQLPGAERFGRYHDLYSVFTSSEQLSPNFNAEIAAHRLSRMILYDRRLLGVGHRRTAKQARRDGFDHFTVQLNHGGSFAAAVPGGERNVAPGEIMLFDMAKPMHSRVMDGRLVTLSVGRELVEAACPDHADRLHGTVLPGRCGGLLADFLVSLTQRAPELSQAALGNVGQAVVELMRLALGGNAPGNGGSGLDGAGRSALDVVRRRRARAFIDANLASDALDTAGIASATGVSRATLARAFTPLGGVGHFVQQRRLQRLRAALLRHGEARTVAELAYAHGFASASHCSRTFQQAFGVPPGQFRAEARRPATLPAPEQVGDCFAAWQREVR